MTKTLVDNNEERIIVDDGHFKIELLYMPAGMQNSPPQLATVDDIIRVCAIHLSRDAPIFVVLYSTRHSLLYNVCPVPTRIRRRYCRGWE
jgi:hypothetical protein